MDDDYYLAADVRFLCPECGEHSLSTVEVPDAVYDQVKKALYGHGFFDLSCFECSQVLTASVENFSNNVEVRLPAYPDTLVETDPARETFYPHHYEAPPENPWGRFLEAFDQLRAVMQKVGSDSDGSHMVNRMVFAQHISAFEAYLAETLVRNVEADPKAIRKLVEADPTLKQMKFDLATFLDEPDIVLTRVRSHLRNIVYHKLPQVNGLYQNALGVKILADKAESDFLTKAVRLRHDCVHRNGFDKEGVKLDAFTPKYIEDVSVTLTQLVGRVEASVQFKGVTVPDSFPF